MKMPLIRDVVFNNIAKNSKKMAEVSVRIYKESDDLIYVSKDKTRRTVLGYTDPDTGLFITNTNDVDKKQHEPYKMFRDYATRIAEEAIEDKLQSLKDLFDNDRDIYESKYKSLPTIEEELTQYITDKQGFYTDIQKQIDIIVSKQLPHVNEYLVYEDDEINHVVTDIVPYKNPKNQTVTAEQKELVDNFLDVFLDEYNKNVLSWYFGATLLNLPLQDDRLSKVLVVSSSNGGSGKSTLINALANGLVTKPYRVIDSGFDKHFRANDKFSTSNLPTCRLGIYSEAYFNSETGTKVPHNFEGLDESEMKSWITEGYVANEKKYADKQIAKLTGTQIIITNHPPQIPVERTDLSRRFLGVIVKPTNMIQEKAVELDIPSEKALYDYVEENAQAFANYFVDIFKRNPKQYRLYSYNTDEYTNDINEGQSEYLAAKQVDDSELSSEDAFVVLSTLGKKYQLDTKDFIAVLMAEKSTSTRKDIRWDKDFLYISSTKAFFIEFGLYPIRDALKDLVGQPVKKYDQRMFKLKRVN